MILYVSRDFYTPKLFMQQRLNHCLEKEMGIIIIIFVYCRLIHATEQKILPQQAEISAIIVAYDDSNRPSECH